MSFAGINATVLQKNNETYFCDPCGNYGQILTIPCGSNAALAQPGTTWAVPVNRDYVQGFEYVVQNTAPTFDSIQVFKLTNLLNGDFYWVIGNQANYYTQCAACCDASPVPSMISTVGNLAPIQHTCTEDGVHFIATFGVSTLTTGRYKATVTLNGALVVSQTYAAGSTSLANLITYLNANAASVGTWSNPANNIVQVSGTSSAIVGFIACNQTS